MAHHEHLIFNTERGELVCEHCGQTYRPALPMPITMFTALIREFTKLHKDCHAQQGQPDLRLHR